MSYLRAVAALMAVFIFAVTQTFAVENKLSAEDLLKHHLDSIGDQAARTAMKSRVVEGTSSYRILVGGSGRIDGKAVLASDGEKMQMLLKVTAQQYTGERFIRNGDRTSVAATYTDKTRSELGRFLEANDLPIREGLLGGVLTTGWSLLDLDAHKSKLHYEGLKKVDGKELQAVVYQPGKTSDLDIVLYFDPENFHHVMTVYTASVHAGLGQGYDITGDPNGPVPGSASEEASARQQQTRYRIEERFSDFKTTDGYTLPSHYDLRFQEELQNGFTKTVVWEVTTSRVLNNIPMDVRNFDIH